MLTLKILVRAGWERWAWHSMAMLQLNWWQYVTVMPAKFYFEHIHMSKEKRPGSWCISMIICNIDYHGYSIIIQLVWKQYFWSSNHSARVLANMLQEPSRWRSWTCWYVRQWIPIHLRCQTPPGATWCLRYVTPGSGGKQALRVVQWLAHVGTSRWVCESSVYQTLWTEKVLAESMVVAWSNMVFSSRSNLVMMMVQQSFFSAKRSQVGWTNINGHSFVDWKPCRSSRRAHTRCATPWSRSR